MLGRVHVTVGSDFVRVSDSGVGMSSEDLKQAFEPFYRAENGRALSSGHGLGLAIVRRLVRQFGWTITVQSEVDEGTSVTIRFRNGGTTPL